MNAYVAIGIRENGESMKSGASNKRGEKSRSESGDSSTNSNPRRPPPSPKSHPFGESMSGPKPPCELVVAPSQV